MKLYHFHSSSTSFRVRMALHLKGIGFEHALVTMRWSDGDHDTEAFKRLNPQGNLPVLAEAEHSFAQSLAICEYLEETRPDPPLLPRAPAERARVRSLCLHIACEIQSMNNLRVERVLANELGFDQEALRNWRRRWIEVGFRAIEAMLGRDAGTARFCHGDSPTFADCFLVPQVYNALRPTVDLDLARWPTISRIYRECLALPAVERALPKNQPGYVDLKEH
jgi:maleylacetoacetate isomerase